MLPEIGVLCHACRGVEKLMTIEFTYINKLKLQLNKHDEYQRPELIFKN